LEELTSDWTERPLILRGERLDFTGFHGNRAALHFRIAASRAALFEYDRSELRRQALEGDGEAAFLIFAFLDACRGAPRTVREAVEKRDEDRRTTVDWPKRAEYIIPRDERLMDECAGIDRERLREDTYRWLQLSALLGYSAGVYQYLAYSTVAVELELRGWAGAVAEFRKHALHLTEKMLREDPKHGFWVSYNQQRGGKFGPIDLVAALANLRALELIAFEDREQLTGAMEQLERRLEDDQVKAARKRGRELCIEYVPRECGG
ncbi:MAG: hypothetical protein R3200_05870, partial [Xanthomonadales bacterium]|nr:hypothetical protein [Xanthomonadales bacterium]